MRLRDDIKRRLLLEVVQENVRARGVSARAVPVSRQTCSSYRWLNQLLALLMPLFFLSMSYALSLLPTEQHTLAQQAAQSIGQLTAQSLGVSTLQSNTSNVAYVSPQPIAFQVLALDVKKIVIDPGHGGKDGGSVTSGGVLEKDLTLDIGQRLRELLEASDFEVLMTRDKDETVSLAQRTTLANSEKADLFVSIHINWIKSPTTCGMETYYLGPTENPEILRLATLENHESGYSLGEYRRLLENVYFNVRQTESRQLATKIQKALVQSLSQINPALANRGVKSAPFLVLATTQMPAVLAEVSCLSNEEEARLLTDPKYRQRIAWALFHGIRLYANSFDNYSARKGS
jgi:N-acetylmuramoyl-L-alanine amidase